MAKTMKAKRAAKKIVEVPKAKATPAPSMPKPAASSKAKAKAVVKAPPTAQGAAVTAAPAEEQVPAKAEFSKLVGFLKYHCRSKDQAHWLQRCKTSFSVLYPSSSLGYSNSPRRTWSCERLVDSCQEILQHPCRRILQHPCCRRCQMRKLSLGSI